MVERCEQCGSIPLPANVGKPCVACGEDGQKLIRLRCLFCDRDDQLGVMDLPTSWDSIKVVPPDKDDDSTHMGVCPDCRRRMNEEQADESIDNSNHRA